MSDLEIHQLRVRIGGVTLLDVARFGVACGAIGVVVSAAAGGKTVFAAALAGSLPAAGEVRVGGRLVEGPPSRRRAAGLAAAIRDGQRVTGCTVTEALGLAGRPDRAVAVFERFPQLARRRELEAALLSGGEQQLLQVAAAWACSPKVMVLDSPTVGLAQDAAAAVKELARDTAAEGAAVLWLEQDLRAAPAAPVARIVRARLETAGEWSRGPA